MRRVSPISFDFNKMEVTFEKEGKRRVLKGSQESGMCKMITGKRLQRMLKSKFSQVAQLFSIQALGVIEEGQELEGNCRLQ